MLGNHTSFKDAVEIQFALQAMLASKEPDQI